MKEEDRYTCPICDYRLKIPRDATRPKLDDLLVWQDEIPQLPFQPEEEETLESIIDHGSKFREYVQQYMNPVMSSPDELTTQRFYLRKLEGADILLAEEINFFRQEVHKWAPVAPEPPPPINVSLSTRKPRPTKQQKLMNQLGLSSPSEIPAHLKQKQFTHPYKPRQSSMATVDGHNSYGAQPGNEQSHTPPGEPPRVQQDLVDQSYFNSHSTSGYGNSPTFTTNATLNFGNSALQAIDPNLFELGGHGMTSPIHDVFRSSGSGQEMFGEVMHDTGGGQAEEALAVTEGNNYLE